MYRRVLAAFIIILGTSGFAGAQDITGDAKAGAKVFKKCSACHKAGEAKNTIGPHLMGIIDRPAGSVEDFKYSKAMIEKADAGLVWTAAELADYLKKPSAKIKGTKMSFPGLKKDKDIANILAYLASLQK
tara:strand:+ start:20153 stop:20542 length:390 start_codon:yes stop_codon:yes gene_type:complete